MLAVHGNAQCIIRFRHHGFERFAPWGAVGPLDPSTRCLALRPIQVVVALSIRYQRVREVARAPGDLDLKGFCRMGRAVEARVDILSTIALPEACRSGVC